MSEGALAIDRVALEALAALLLERAGLKITPDGFYGLRLALQARMPALGLSDAQDYVRRLRQLAGEHELRSLLPLVTVGKTEFFRDGRQFMALEQEILPQLLSLSRREQRAVRIWSAGCATGEEPYSLAMLCRELGAATGEVDIWASDLNPAAVESAERGVFPTRRMIGLSEERIARWFDPVQDGFQVKPVIRNSVRFAALNLAAPVFHSVTPGSLDLILCRNVIIYFAQPTIQLLMDKFYEALRVGGVLLLGYSESLFKLYARFEMFEISRAFAYRRPAQAPRPKLELVVPPKAPEPPPRPPLAKPTATSSGRLSPRAMPVPALEPLPSPPRRPRTPEERLADVAALLEAAAFPKALLAARRFSDEYPEDLSARLTLGNVQALMGDHELARDTFHTALSQEPLCVEARVYLALAGMQAGAHQEARAELTRALFLEPTLALGHYLLGQVCERLSEVNAARRSYRNAVALKRAPQRALLGHYPDLPKSAEAIAQAAQYRVAALEEK